MRWVTFWGNSPPKSSIRSTMRVLLLNHRQIRELLPITECIELMADALSALARGEVYQPLRTIVRPPEARGLLGLMPAYRAGAQVHAIGTHSPNSREIDGATMAAARIFVDRRESALNEAGDYLLAAKEGLVTPESISGEIGELLIGTKSGRISDSEITLFKSLGLAIEDVTTANYLYNKATELNAG